MFKHIFRNGALIIVLTHTAFALGQVLQNDNRFDKQGRTVRQREIVRYDPTFERIGDWLYSVTHHVDSENPATKNEVSKSDLESLYKNLTDLQAERAKYLRALQSLIDAKEHPSQPVILQRSQKLRSEAKQMGSLLEQLSGTLAPLKLKIDVSHPDLGGIVREYGASQQAIVDPTIDKNTLGGYSSAELSKLHRDAIANGERLKKAIDELLAVIRDQIEKKGNK